MEEEFNNPFVDNISAPDGLSQESDPQSTQSIQDVDPPSGDDTGVGDYIADAGVGIARGAVGFGQSVYDLFDFISFDALPDVDLKEMADLSETKTWVGGLTEGLTQFATGFGIAGVALKGVSAAGKLGKFGKMLLKNKANGKTSLNLKGEWVAGATADFVSFGGQEERLSNLLIQYPALKNPVTEYLASDSDDNEIEGRFKNVVEGMFLEWGVALPMVGVLKKSLDVLKKGREEIPLSELTEEGLKKRIEDANELASGVDAEVQSLELPTLHPTQNPSIKKTDEVVADAGESAVVKSSDGDKTKDGSPVDVDGDVIDSTPVDPTTEVGDVKSQAKSPITTSYDLIKEEAKKLAQNYKTGGTVRHVIPETTKDHIDSLYALNDALKEAAPKVEKRSTKKEYEDLAADMRSRGFTDDAKAIELEAEKIKDMTDEQIARIDESTAFRNTITVRLGQIQTNFVDALDRSLKITDIDSPEFAESLAEVNSLMRAHHNVAASRSLIGTSYAQALQGHKNGISNKVNMNPKGKGENELAKFNGFTEQNLSNEELVNLAKIFKAKEEAIYRNPEVLTLLMEGAATAKVKFGDRAYTYWVNSLLSGPKTHAANPASGLLNSVVKAASLIGGGIVGGNPELTKAMLNFGFKNLGSFNAFKMLRDGLKDGVSPFEGINGKSVADAVKYNQIDLTTHDGALGWIWENIVKFPTKALSATDGVMKAYNFRVAAQTKLAYEAATVKGMVDPKQIQDYVDHGMASVLTNGGALNNPSNVRKELIKKLKDNGRWEKMTPTQRSEALAKSENRAKKRLEYHNEVKEYAGQYADEATYTQELTGKMQKVSESLQKFPGSRWVVPFVRTPINVLSRPIDIATSPLRMAGYLVPSTKFPHLEAHRSKILGDLASADPMKRAEAQGKATIGSGALFSMFAIVNSNNISITGAGPQEPSQRKRLEDAGWQKYSIKVGDKYYSYQKLDPVATILGLAADYRDMAKDPSTAGSSSIENIFSAAFVSMTNNIMDKSFLAGLDMAMGAIQDEKSAKKWINSMVGSFVPSVIPQTREIMTGSPDLVESWSLMDTISKRTGINAGALDKKRNILGEEVDAQVLDSVMDRGFDIVANVSEDKDDIVLDEIASLREGFDIPSKKIVSGLDLTEDRYRDPETKRTAYDTYRKLHGTVKINGKTLRQEMTKAIKSKWYQNINPQSLPNYRSKRISELQKIIRKYRNEALAQTLKKIPDLGADHNIAMGLRTQNRQGVDVQAQVEEFLNQTN